MLQLLTCSRGHSWEAAADDGAAIGRAVCPVCGDAVELLPLLDLAPSPEGIVLAPEPVLPQAPPLRDAAGKPVVAGFEILEELGRSPLGVRCYKAKQLLVNRTVLLKVVVARDDAGQVGWGALRGEAAALGRLGHPNVVQILEAGERERQLFYNAVEWVEGPTLAEHAAARPMPPRQAARLVEVLARAVHAAHEQGVAHRGLRPACVRLQPQPEGNKGASLSRRKPRSGEPSPGRAASRRSATSAWPADPSKATRPMWSCTTARRAICRRNRPGDAPARSGRPATFTLWVRFCTSCSPAGRRSAAARRARRWTSSAAATRRRCSGRRGDCRPTWPPSAARPCSATRATATGRRWSSRRTCGRSPRAAPSGPGRGEWLAGSSWGRGGGR